MAKVEVSVIATEYIEVCINSDLGISDKTWKSMSRDDKDCKIEDFINDGQMSVYTSTWSVETIRGIKEK